MKRIISFLTVLSLLAATFAMAAMPISAEVNNHYDDSLVSWWNFAGETEAEQKEDKAKKGTADSLTFSNITVENNSAYINHETGHHITIPYKGDLSDLNGKTFYMSYRVESGTTTSNANDLININGSKLFRYYLANVTTTESYSIGGEVGTDRVRYSAAEGTPVKPASDWYYMAATFSVGTGGLTVKVYNSADGSSYVMTQSVSAATTSAATTRVIVIGKTSTAATQASRGVSFTINEMRVYDEILPAEEIAALASYTPYSVTVPELKPVDGLLDANLVSYYNFSGETADEQFADKAPNGTASDKLISSDNISVENGVANIPHDQYEYLAIPKTGDGSDLAGKTIYMAYRADTAVSGSNANEILRSNGLFRYYLKGGSTPTNYVLAGQVVSTTYTCGGDTPAAPSGDWYYVAVTFDLTESGLKAKVYNSANGIDYVATETTVAGVTAFAPSGDLFVGKSHANVEDRGVTFSVNEIRIYDKVLSEREVKMLSQVAPQESPINVLGWQEKLNETLMDVRFLAHLNVTEADLARFSEVGFEISATLNGVEKSTKVIGSQKVYNTIIAEGNEITVGSYDHVDGYIVALPIYNVPMSGTVTFTVKPYCISGGVTQYGETVTATYIDGAPVA